MRDDITLVIFTHMRGIHEIAKAATGHQVCKGRFPHHRNFFFEPVEISECMSNRVGISTAYVSTRRNQLSTGIDTLCQMHSCMHKKSNMSGMHAYLLARIVFTCTHPYTLNKRVTMQDESGHFIENALEGSWQEPKCFCGHVSCLLCPARGYRHTLCARISAHLTLCCAQSKGKNMHSHAFTRKHQSHIDTYAHVGWLRPHLWR
jgi:hypothetical protein